MKKIVKFLTYVFIVMTCFITTGVFAASDENIERAVLIENYLIKHREKVLKFTQKYKFDKDEGILRNLEKIDSLILSLKRIQNNNIWTEESAISIILSDIKVVNENLKDIMNQKKKEYDRNLDKQQMEFQNTWVKLSDKLDEIYDAMYYKYDLNKPGLSEKESQIKKCLKSLNLLSKEIRYFSYKTFDTQEEMQSSFLSALNSIKYHILVLKENIWNKNFIF